MLHLRRRIAWLLAGLLLVQALAVAHAFDHPPVGQGDHQCAVCLHGHGGGHALVAEAPAMALPRHREPTAAPALPPRATSGFHPYRSRAPPVPSPLQL